MSFDYINEAFRKLSLLKEETFDTSKDGISKLSAYIDEDDSVDTLDVIDMDASNEYELEDSYIGKVIINCNVCHSHIFKAKEDVVIDTEGVVNLEDECPYCGEKSGFIVVGEIVEFAPESNNESDVSVEVDGEEIPTADEEPTVQELEESKKSRNYSKKILKMLEEDGCEDTNNEESLEEATSVLDRPRDVTMISGTVADVLNRNSSAIDACGSNEIAVKRTIENILRSEDVNDPEAAEEAIAIINRCKGSKLWSTIGTYMSGLKVTPVGKFAKRRLDASLETEETLTEAVNNVNVETDDSVVNVHTEENGKVVVSTEPKVDSSSETEGEMIAPISDETISEIESENGVTDPMIEDPESETPEEVDVEIDEIDEESMDELGESYLRNVYNNVESFKTTSVSNNDTHMIIEGLITFSSGAQKKTGFIFEAQSATASGKVSFVGMNEHFSKRNKAFKLEGVVKNNKFLPESLTYNYRTLLTEGKVNTISGTVTLN